MSCYPLTEMFTLMLQGAPHTTALLSYPVNTKYNTHDTSSGPRFWSIVYRTTWMVTWQRDSSNNSHCHLLVDELPIFFCYLLQTVMLPLHRSPFWSAFLAHCLLEIVTHPVHCLPCLWNFVCPDTDNGPLFSLVICSYQSWFPSLKLAVENEIRRRLHFCSSNKTLRTPCTW